MNKLIFKFGLIFTLNFLFFALISKYASAYPLKPQVSMDIGGDMHLVKIADIDNDGNNDLIVTDGKVIRGFVVLFGNGNGTFSSPLEIGDESPYEWGLNIADMNNDGLQDVVVTNGALDTIQVSLNSGARTFSPAVSFAVGEDISAESAVSIGDVNNDGNIDVIVAGSVNAFHIFLGDGAGSLSFSASVSANDPQSYHSDIELFDFNGDSILDVITTNNSALGDIEFFVGNGSGGFTYDHSLADMAARSFTLADIDGDSQSDIIYSQSGIGVFVIKQDGTLITSFANPGVEMVEATDINLDGNVDIVFSDNAVTGIQVAISTGGGSFDPLTSYNVNFSPLGIAFGDLDGDNLPDVAAVNHGNILSVFLTDPPITPDVIVIGSPAASEGGASGYFDVVLGSNPTDVVIVEFTPAGSQIGFPKAGVCFVPSGVSTSPGTPYDPCTTWNVGQSVQIDAVNDLDVEDVHYDQVVFSTSSKDTNYDGFSTSNLPVTVYDNEILPTVQINYSTKAGNFVPANVSESGINDTVKLSLNGIPADNVTITCTPATPSQISFAPNPISFIFSPATSATPQSVEVSAIDDLNLEGDHSVVLNCLTLSNDKNYNGLTLNIAVNIKDNDNPVTPPPVDPQETPTPIVPPAAAENDSSPANTKTLASTGGNRMFIIGSAVLLLISSLLSIHFLKRSSSV